MKKFITILSCCLAFCTVYANVPNKIKHQGAIHLSNNKALSNQPVIIKISIEKNEANGEVVFQETHNLITDNFGYFSLEIGDGNVLSGNFAQIDWSTGNYFLKTEFSSDNGNYYNTIGNSQILSVPYAYAANNLYSSFPNGSSVGDMLYWKDNDWKILPVGQMGQYLGIENQSISWIDIPNCKMEAISEHNTTPITDKETTPPNFPYIGYQLTIRNQQTLFVNQNVGIQVSILQGSNSGSCVYKETFQATSDNNGIVSLMIGSGKNKEGDFYKIDWSKANFFVKTQIDLLGGENYTIENSEQILSVPYAFCIYSSVCTAQQGDLLFWSGNNWTTLPVGEENNILVVAKNNTPTWIDPKSVSDDFGEILTQNSNLSDIIYSLYDTTKLILSSSLASRIIIAHYPDGSAKYVDGTEIEKAGLLLQMDKDYPDRCLDTIWADYLKIPSFFVKKVEVEWKILDPNVARINKTYSNEDQNYACIEALKEGTTKLIAYADGMTPDTIDVIVSTKWVKSLKYNVRYPAGFYNVESATGTFYDYDVRAQNDTARRMDQYVLRARVNAEEAGAEVGYPVTWEFTSSDTSIITNAELVENLTVTPMGEFNESIMIETVKVNGKGLIERLNEGKEPYAKDSVCNLSFTITARAAYFAVEALMTIKPTNAITPIDSVTWLDKEGKSTDSYEITTETKSSPAPTELSVLALPSAIDHLVDGFRFGIVGDATLNNSLEGSSISNEYVSLHTLWSTRSLGTIGIRGLKAGTVKIWVEIGDAALGGNFTVEEYGEPKRDTLTINIASAITSVDIYNEGESSAIGTYTQTMTEGDTRVFEAKITDEEAHSLFKGNVVWKTSGNEAGYISVVPDPSDPSKVTVTALKKAMRHTAPKLWAVATDGKGNEKESSKFSVEVEEAASNEAEGLEFISAEVLWEDPYGMGGDYYSYVFTTANGEELVVAGVDPNIMGFGTDAFMFDEDKTWTIGENGDEDIYIIPQSGVGITIKASGTEYWLMRGTITISNGGTSATIDLIAVPIVDGVEGIETKVTGTWSGTKPADPRP